MYPEFLTGHNPAALAHRHLFALPDVAESPDRWAPPSVAVDPAFPMREFDTWKAERNTLGHGFAFAQLFGHVCRYSYGEQCWYVYDGRVWIRDDGRIMDELRRAARERYVADVARYRRLLRHSEDDYRVGEAGQASDDASRFAHHVQSALSTPKALAMMVDAARTTSVQGRVVSQAVDVAAFDNHRHLLSTLNCVLDLRNGVAMAHDPTLMLTKLAPIVYDPAAVAPRFMKAVLQIMGGDLARVAFLQRVFGYLMTEEARERKVVVFLGLRGSNGKTTLANILTRLLGTQFVSSLPVATLLEKRFGADEIDVGLTSINGKRVVIAVEPNANARFNSGVIKALAGNDLAGPAARRPHQRELEAIKPGAKILLLTNHVPHWEDDKTFNERFLLVPFEQEFRGEAERRNLGEELVGAEGPGILNWMLDGARLYYERGLEVPGDIADDTAELRLEGNLLEGWFQACCVADPEAMASVTELHESYQWHLTEVLKAPANDVLSMKAFSPKLNNWKVKRSRGRWRDSTYAMSLVRGIRLKVRAGGLAED